MRLTYFTSARYGIRYGAEELAASGSVSTRQLGSHLSLLVSAFAEKILQNRSAFFVQNTRCDFTTMIQGRHLQEIHHATRSASRGIWAAEDHAPDSRVHKRACAHSAWLLGDIKIAIRQTPIADGRFSLCQRQHFGVRGRVLQ